MKPIVHAGFVAAGLLGILAFLIFKIFPNWTQPKGITSVDILDQMEKVGIKPFHLKTIEAKDFQLNDILDRVTVVHFWASWCPPCLEEFPSIIKFSEENKSIIFLAISVDESDSDVRNFLKAFGKLSSNVVVLRDPASAVATQYGTVKLPESYIFGKDKKLVRKIPNSLNWTNPDVASFLKALTIR